MAHKVYTVLIKDVGRLQGGPPINWGPVHSWEAREAYAYGLWIVGPRVRPEVEGTNVPEVEWTNVPGAR
jgi:hypothetical protein